MREFNTWRDPYGEGFSTCRPKKIQIQSGLTVLVGCNGAGKTTLLHNIKQELENQNIPVASFDNLHDGGTNSISSAVFNDEWNLLGGMMSSSEGETIGLNIGRWLQGVRNFIKDGQYRTGRKLEGLSKIFLDPDEVKEKEEALRVNDERWILLDAADSGYSIDDVIDLKQIFQLMQKNANVSMKQLYVIISANEYELARNENCFDVNAGKYITFNDYEDFRKFIIKSREKKNKRYAKLNSN